MSKATLSLAFLKMTRNGGIMPNERKDLYYTCRIYVVPNMGCSGRTRTFDLLGYEPGKLPLLYTALVETPGAAPGSRMLMSSFIYHHSQLPSQDNLGSV